MEPVDKTRGRVVNRLIGYGSVLNARLTGYKNLYSSQPYQIARDPRIEVGFKSFSIGTRRRQYQRLIAIESTSINILIQKRSYFRCRNDSEPMSENTISFKYFSKSHKIPDSCATCQNAISEWRRLDVRMPDVILMGRKYMSPRRRKHNGRRTLLFWCLLAVRLLRRYRCKRSFGIRHGIDVE